MKTVKEVLEEIYLSKRVKITIGHKNNNQYIIGTVLSFDGDLSGKFFILLGDITGTPEQKHMIEEGLYNRHYFRFNTEIGILRYETINEVLAE
jgi:hypothetical protein